MLYDNNSTENINPLKADLLMPSLKNRWHMFSPLVSLMSVKSFRMRRSSWSIIRNWCIKVNDAQHNSLCQHSRVHNYSTDWLLNQFGTYHTIWYVSNPSAASIYIRLLPIMPMCIRTVLADEISFGFWWCQRAVALLEWHPSLLYAVMDSDVTWSCLSWNSNLHKQTIKVCSAWPRSARLPCSRENSPTAISLCVPSCLLFFPLPLSSLLLSFNGPLTYKC